MAALQVGLADSNIANLGGAEEKAARLAAAQSDPAYHGAGAAAGVEVWRVENVRNADGSPNFGVQKWPRERYGEFLSGDSFVVLQTTADKATGKLSWDAHYWVGPDSSQVSHLLLLSLLLLLLLLLLSSLSQFPFAPGFKDEYAVAAIKVVQLDDLLGGKAVIHHQTQGHESRLFMSAFGGQVSYHSGGIDSGFRHAAPETYEPRLFQVRKMGRQTRAFQVPLARDSLNHGDAFVLDAGTIVYKFCGDDCSPFEKAKAAKMAFNISQSRGARAHCHDPDEAFWALLGGEGEIAPASERPPPAALEKQPTRMFHITDVDSVVRHSEVPASRDSLNDSDAYCVDVGDTIFVWVGTGATRRESQQAFVYARHLVKEFAKPKSTRILMVKAGQEAQTGFFEATAI